MKNKLLLASIVSGLLISSSVRAEVIVNDPTAITKMLTQIENLKNQLAVQKQTFQSLSHTTNLGSLLDSETSDLMNNLPSNWQSVYDDALSSSSSVTGSVSSMVSTLNDKIDNMTPQNALKYINKQMSQKGAADRYMAAKAYDNEMSELDSMQDLQKQIASTGDMKDIADLQARIQTAQGAIQGEQAKLQLMSMLQDSEDKIYQQQRDRAAHNLNHGINDTVNPAPLY